MINSVAVVFLAGIALLIFIVMIAAVRTFLVRQRLPEPPISERVRRIQSLYRHKRRFAVHAALYGVFSLAALIVLVDPLFWHDWVTLPNNGDIFLIWVIWSAVFAAHGVNFYFQHAEDREVLRVLDTDDMVNGDKPKHDRLFLTDDGEVLHVADATDDDTERLYYRGGVTDD